MSNPILTDVGRTYIADQDAGGQSVNLTEFKLGDPNIGGSNPADPLVTMTVQTNVVWTGAPTAEGKLDVDSVVVSLLLGSDVGDFDITQIGLYSDTGVLVFVANIPPYHKRAVGAGELGNNFAFNANLVYSSLAALANITAAAETWQQDFTALLALKEDKAEKGAVNGYASLDGSGDVPLDEIPNTLTGKDADTVDGYQASALEKIASKGAVNGYASLDGAGDVPDAQIPAGIARLAGPTLTGVPKAPTAAPGVNNTQISTTAFVAAAIAALLDSSPAALDTLNELAAALGDDPNFATTMTNALAAKQATSQKGAVNGYASLNGAGDVPDAQIPNLAASKITSGVLADARIPSLNASKITAGILNQARVPFESPGPIGGTTPGTLKGTNLALTGAAPGTPAANTTYKDNVCKGWISFNGSGVIAIRDSFNVSGIIDYGTGDFEVTWDRNFASADYSWTGSAQRGTSGTVTDVEYVSGRKVAANPAAGSLRVTTINASATLTNPEWVNIQAFGAQ